MRGHAQTHFVASAFLEKTIFWKSIIANLGSQTISVELIKLILKLCPRLEHLFVTTSFADKHLETLAHSGNPFTELHLSSWIPI